MRLLDIHLGAGSNDPIEQVEKGRCDKKIQFFLLGPYESGSFN